MSAIDNIIYQSVVYLAPVLLCVLGGIFAYKANVLNIALEGMMMAGAFVSMLAANLTNSLPAAYLSAFAVCMALGLVFSVLGVTLKGNVIVIGLAINMLVPAVAGFIMKIMSVPSITWSEFPPAASVLNIPVIQNIPPSGPHPQRASPHYLRGLPDDRGDVCADVSDPLRHPRPGGGGERRHRRLNLAQLDPMPHMLDLKILSGKINNLSALIVFHDIACPINQLRYRIVQWILHEGFSRLFRILIVAHGQGCAPHTKLSRLLPRYRLIFLIQHENVRVRHGESDRKRFLVGKLAVYHIISTCVGNLRRTVQVRILYVRQKFPPHIQLLVRHDLAAEHHPPQRIRQIHVL